LFTIYSGNTITVTDQAGKKRQSTTDGLGRLTQVVEDPGGRGYVTNYTYDALDNLLSVVQAGSRQRTFNYDSLSRLLCASNPENSSAACPSTATSTYTAGTTGYTYDANGNLATKIAPAPNQTGTATVTTTYTYDAINRIKQRSYSDGTTPQAVYVWDNQDSSSGVPNANNIGRLRNFIASNPSTGSYAGSIYNYDAMGRIATSLDCIQPCSYDSISSYTYDLLGDVTTYTNKITPWGSAALSSITFNQSFDSAGRVTQLTSSLVDGQHPSPLATVDSSVAYWPTGALRKVGLGNGLYETAAYNNRLQSCRMNVNSTSTYVLTQCTDSLPSSNVLDFTYGYNSGTSNNGNVASWSATGQQAFNRSFAYDSLNRISQMQETSGNQESCKPSSSPTNPYTLSWTIDPWGNRTNQTPSTGTCSFSQSVDTQNRLLGSPYQYDAAGNMAHDGTHSYTYDAENRIIQVDGGATASYGYDPSGRRASKTTGGTTTSYVYDQAGNVVFEIQGTSWVTTYIYFAGALRAQYKNGVTSFMHRDHLGSTRLVTAMNQSVSDNLDYLPFGEQIAGSSASIHKFTGKERDSESGLDNFGARYDSSSMGRFMSPDPIYIEEQKMLDPQQLNLYSYVRNNPLNLTDSTGMLVDVNCQQVNAQQCAQTVTDLNNRKDAAFQVTRDDKTGQLNVVDPQNVDPSTLSSGEKALYDAITNKDATGTLTVVGNDQSFDFEKSTGKGANSLDRSDLNALNGADKRLSGEIIAHAALESFNSAKPGVSVDQAHELAAQSFGFKYGRFTPNFASQVNSLFLNFRSTRLNEDFRATLTLKTPIPMVTFRKMQAGGGVLTLPRDVTKVSLLP
jgi:RHS repeat-associated protein